MRSEPLLVAGNGTKPGMLRPVQAARSLSTRNLTGITLYSPNELIISARAGTPLAEIEATLAEHGQHIIAEPPDLAAHLRRPRAADARRRDRHQSVRSAAHRLGCDARSRPGHSRGHRARRGDPLRRTGAEERHRARPVQAARRQPRHARRHHRDDAEGAAGAGGDRYVVLPGLDAAAGVAALSAALGSPFGVSAAAWLPREAAARVPALAGLAGSVALVRIEDFAASVDYRTARLRDDLGHAGRRDPRRRSIARGMAGGAPPGAAAGGTRRRDLADLGAPVGGSRRAAVAVGHAVRGAISTGAAVWSGSRHRRPPRRTTRSRRPRRPPAVPGC